MHVEQTTYDASSVESILRYARQLEGTTLRDACEIDEVANPRKRRGSFGNALEKYFFHYDINNSPDADFREAETELKSTPLRKKKNGEFSAKERLVISKINYMTVVDETWETSSLQKKLHKILLVARWAGLTDFIIRKVVSLPIVERFRKRRQARLLNEYRSNHSAGRHGKLRCSLEFSDK